MSKIFILNDVFIVLILSLLKTDYAACQEKVEIPAPVSREDVVHHTYYSVSFIKAYELASWVAYELTADEAAGNLPFRESFEADPGISSGTGSLLKDYKKSEYISALLAPVGDMRFSETSISECFYISNAVPQKPAFNKFTWLKMGDLVRAWAEECGSLYIVSGPVLKDAPFPTFGKSMVSIPSRYYRVVLDLKNERGMGFLVKNSITAASLKPYALSIDEAEEITGIDFFPALPDELEERIESAFHPEDWNFDILDQ